MSLIRYLRRLALVWLFCAVRVASADDLADEADLMFALGTEAYQRGDYREALARFLACNRLVPNKNVVFNIARTYETLGLYPEAYRYYDAVLALEQQAEDRAKIEQALERIRPRVVVLHVLSDPPGATLYVDRRDLGPRGTAPRSLGLAPGRYRIMAELEGHEPSEAMVEAGQPGSEVVVRLRLVPILGSVWIAGPPGATVAVRGGASSSRCVAPCLLRLAPGTHRLHFELQDHRGADLPVEVEAYQRVEVRAELEPLTGHLVVSSDEPGALIEVDGRPWGFAPAILRLPVGNHRVRVSLAGFHPVERVVRIVQDVDTRLEVELARVDEVQAASRTAEPVEDAPSSVSIVPRRELEAFAYPTIAEALRGLPGVCLWDDRSYVGLGIRGLGRLGSYGNRLLVLQDETPTNDNWIGSSYVGYDGLTDLGDIERIEVVRGPGSALYGTGAFSGVVNLVTRRNLEPGLLVGVSTNQDGVARARLRGDLRLGQEAGSWASLAAARSRGRDFYFPEFAADASASDQPGLARGMDGFESSTARGRWWWRSLSVNWYLHRYRKQLPTAPFGAIFGDPRAWQTDTRGLLEVRAEPHLGRQLALVSRAHLNLYRFHGQYPEPPPAGLETDTYRGQWLGFEQRITYAPLPALRLTAGAEAQIHYQVEQTARNQNGYYLRQVGQAARPYQVGAGYLVVDSELGQRLRISAGARVDGYSTFGGSINPRTALIWRPYPGGNTKLLLGKAFRAPSVYELYYEDGQTQVASPELEPESVYSAELEHTHHFSSPLTLSLAGYANHVEHLVYLGSNGQGRMQFRNLETGLGVVGAEIGLRRQWRQGWMLETSYSHSRARFLASTNLVDLFRWRPDPTRREVSNVALHGASFKAAVPLLVRDLTLASRLTLEGPRWDRNELESDPPQLRTDPAVIWDLVLSGHEDRWNLGWAVGAYNLFDWDYELPVGSEHRQRTVPQAGRSFLASLEFRL